MELTKSQIENLYAFTSQHYVEYYDLQTELVDHLANDIEVVMTNDSSISFEKAKDIAFQKFGVFGFQDIIAQKHKALGKKYRSILGRLFLEWFGIPKILLTTLCMGIYYWFLNLFGNEEIVFFSFLLISCYVIVKAYLLKKKHNQKTKETGKKWFMESYIFTIGASNLILCSIPLTSFDLMDIDFNSNWVKIFAAILITVHTIISYITLHIIPSQSEKILKENYPEYSM